MKIERIINNNIVTSHQNGSEVVVMGKGIGFKKEIGTKIAQDSIEKIFSLDTPTNTDKFTSLLQNIPLEEIQAINEIVSYAKLSLGK
ncbi:TPA: CAT RNA binding domain-containing protein [Enterococcus faecium]